MTHPASGDERPLRLEALVTSGLLPISAARLVDPLRIAQERFGATTRLHVDQALLDQPLDGFAPVFLRYRPHGLPATWPLMRALVLRGYLTIADVDDLLWEPAGAADRRGEAERVRQFRESDYVAYRGVHAIQVSTPALADAIRHFNPEVKVFPAAIADVPDFRPRPSRPPRLLFAALNRAADWQPILGPLNRVLKRRPDVLVATLHDEGFHAALKTRNKQLFGFQRYPQYLHTIGECDVALLPLSDTKFNRAKSDLKFVECASRGAAVLASATMYGDSIEDGVTGLLYRTPAEFETQLKRLLSDPELRTALARAAHEWVVRHRRLEDGVAARLAWYRELFADKARLDAGILERAGWVLQPDGSPVARPDTPA